MALSTDHTDIPLAIIGMACRLPEADNLEQYWQLIVEGRSAIREIPAERFDEELYFDPAKGVRGKSYAKLAALLGNRDFDYGRNPIDQQLAQSVDRMHLLMTGVAADALRHAGLDPFRLRTKNAAVFIGNGGSSERLRETNYQAHLVEAIHMLDQAEGFADLAPDVRQQVIAETIARIKQPTLPPGADARLLQCNMIAGTIAKAFGLTGGWLALNSACASSLQAILMGARVLQQGRAEMAIVGGASDIHSHTLVLFSAAQALSACGSRPFDVDADGLVMCEGYGALVMKTLERALADGDPIQAVIRGLGVATDGRGKSLWAPRKEGQIKAMRRAYRSGVELSRLQYIECHATATQLGDATELETLGEVLRPELPAGTRVPVTSVKANIGHALEAAGIAGVIKTVLCMQRQTIPPAINIETLNPKIDWQSAPYYVPRQPAPWNAPADGGPRRAAVNAFGIGGLNMHVVLDEFTESARQLVAAKAPKTVVQPAASPDDQSVAIIGMGCILPGGLGLAKLWESLLTGHDPKSTAESPRWTPNALADCNPRIEGMVGGFMHGFTYDWRKHKVPPKQVAEADPLQFMLLEAAEQALNDAGYDHKPLAKERCGVVVGTEVGGEFCDELEMGLRLPEMQQVIVELLRQRGVPADKIAKIKADFAATLLRKWPSLVDETGSFTSSTLASRVTKTLDLAGGAVAVDAGSISALSALAICYDMLLSGDNDIMILRRRTAANGGGQFRIARPGRATGRVGSAQRAGCRLQRRRAGRGRGRGRAQAAGRCPPRWRPDSRDHPGHGPGPSRFAGRSAPPGRHAGLCPGRDRPGPGAADRNRYRRAAHCRRCGARGAGLGPRWIEPPRTRGRRLGHRAAGTFGWWRRHRGAGQSEPGNRKRNDRAQCCAATAGPGIGQSGRGCPAGRVCLPARRPPAWRGGGLVEGSGRLRADRTWFGGAGRDGARSSGRSSPPLGGRRATD